MCRTDRVLLLADDAYSRGLNAVFAELLGDGLCQVKIDIPVVRRLAPGTDRELHRFVCAAGDPREGSRILEYLFVLVHDLEHEALDLLRILALRGREGEVDTAGLLCGIVDDVGSVIRELFFLGEIAVMDDGVDMTDGAVKAYLVEVIVTAGVVEVEHATVFQRLGHDAVGEALLRQVLEHIVFGAVVVGKEVELFVLEADFVIDLQGVVVAV